MPYLPVRVSVAAEARRCRAETATEAARGAYRAQIRAAGFTGEDVRGRGWHTGRGSACPVDQTQDPVGLIQFGEAPPRTVKAQAGPAAADPRGQGRGHVTKRRVSNPSDQGSAPPRHEPDYAELIRAVQAGSHAAMERLLMRAQGVAYRFSLLVCGGADDADDAMQEALLKTYRYAARIREPEAFRTWLYRTVRHACLIGRRRRVGEPARLLSLDEMLPVAGGHARAVDAVDPARGPEDAAINARLRDRLGRALKALPPPYRLVVFLREIEGLTTREVARVVGISEANVKTRLHRARLMLREELDRT